MDVTLAPVADSTLRQRPGSLAADPPSPNSAPNSPPLLPTLPSPRPSLSRSLTGDATPSYSIEEDDIFAGLSLLDLLVVVDAHLELFTRGIRKKTVGWREKADRLVEESRARAQKIQKIKLPRVNVLDDTLDALSPKDRESLERKYKEVRDRTLDSFRKLSQKWEEEKTVRLRDKISFFAGVMNVTITCLLLGFEPTWVPAWYTAQVAFFLPYRFYTYKKKLFHYFLFDFCYLVNALCLIYLWILPGNTYLLQACVGLSLGTLGSAIATWRNSLVFHSLDKVISLAIHILPPFVFTTIRHFYPNAEERYTALKSLPHLQPWRAIAINMGVYLLWQAAYYRYVIIARKEKIKQGRPTSFTWMVNDRRRLVGKIAARVPEQYREGTFMLGQAVYTFVTLLIPIFVLYDSKFWSSVYLLTLFGVSVWNGGCFYLDVFARRFEKELIKLRKEFEEQQVALEAARAGGIMDGESRPQSMDGAAEAVPAVEDAVAADGGLGAALTDASGPDGMGERKEE